MEEFPPLSPAFGLNTEGKNRIASEPWGEEKPGSRLQCGQNNGKDLEEAPGRALLGQPGESPVPCASSAVLRCFRDVLQDVLMHGFQK